MSIRNSPGHGENGGENTATAELALVHPPPGRRSGRCPSRSSTCSSRPSARSPNAGAIAYRNAVLPASTMLWAREMLQLLGDREVANWLGVGKKLCRKQKEKKDSELHIASSIVLLGDTFFLLHPMNVRPTRYSRGLQPKQMKIT